MSNPYAAPQFPSEPTPEQPAPTQPAPKKKKKGGCLKWGAGALAVFVLGSAALNAGSDGDSSNTAAPEPRSSITATESLDAELSTPTVDITNAAAELDSTSGNDAGAGNNDEAVPQDYTNALRAAKRYLDFSAFSEAKLYNQLTSDYGSQFSPEAAQYSIDQLDVDWNAEALESAENYLDFAAFSKAKLYDQLTSEYGDSFTPEQAQYAVDTVNGDWMAEAVEAANSYQEMMPMSGPALLEQLTSEYGEKFTMEEAQHAVSTLGL
ncbi:Ltp family lipoprotein [uncultured Corynebacterium sp.]|uniref:Ltp family lipoprotein n=1 Tax=uncultured Corynebacterium sp. TaxID=159447 RepID=UPI0025CDDD96|nr:Ltp family lipoprotein [uncultured Corynebacterium sp.]